jgi:hypothetical protein
VTAARNQEMVPPNFHGNGPKKRRFDVVDSRPVVGF